MLEQKLKREGPKAIALQNRRVAPMPCFRALCKKIGAIISHEFAPVF
jgi:hypothetical protein